MWLARAKSKNQVKLTGNLHLQKLSYRLGQSIDDLKTGLGRSFPKFLPSGGFLARSERTMTKVFTRK